MDTLFFTSLSPSFACRAPFPFRLGSSLDPLPVSLGNSSPPAAASYTGMAPFPRDWLPTWGQFWLNVRG